MRGTATAPSPSTTDTAGAPLDQSQAPMLDGIRRFRDLGAVPFSTPGHKMGVGAAPELVDLFGIDALRNDVPHGGGIDDTHFNGGILEEAERLAAAAFGAERTFFLVNGSTAGNLAVMLATVGPGDEVIVARDIHKSILLALIFSGAKPVYVAPRLHPTENIGLGIEPATVAAALDAHPRAKLVVVVSPSYCGVASDLAAIAALAHARGVPVHVDEAWGPHFHFHPALPPSAMASGVDSAVSSAHKVLGSFTQGAFLNLQGPRIDPARVKSTVGMAQTTSPSAMIFASIDAARRQMALHGESLLDRTIAFASDARRRLRTIPGVGILDGESLDVPAYDLTKLVIDVDGLGLTGFEAEHELRNRLGIAPESSDLAGVVCLVTIGDTAASIDRLVDAFEQLSRERGNRAHRDGAGLRSSGAVISPGVQAMTPREAFFAPSRAVAPADAVGEVSAELVIPYPPGIPVLAPGDVITSEKIAFLREGAAQGMYLSGPIDQSLATIRVVDQAAPGR